MTTVHLVYPHRPRISCPDAIGRELGLRLQNHYHVVHHDWDESRLIRPAPGDVLLGHAHPSPWSCFRRSLRQPGWRRVILMEPYNHGDPRQVAFLDPIVSRCDLFLAITGRYWYELIERSLYAHWRPKMIHLDLAVNRRDFPVLKTTFNPPGKRRFVYIGRADLYKNIAYLSEIARLMDETPFYWIGSGAKSIPALTPLGFQNFATTEGQQVVAAHDFMVTVGKADANPTTILEAMAWGLIPVCTPQSGYVNQPGIINIPVDDAPATVAILRRLQETLADELKAMQDHNWRLLDSHYNWDRFAYQVVEAIESKASPPLFPLSPSRRLVLRWLALTSPYAPWRPFNLARFLYAQLKQ